MMTPPIILVAGPTASGKSALALELAERLGGEIVGADSMQIYRDLRLLSARPTPQEEARVAHHLIGVVDAAEPWSVGWWLEAARTVIADLRADGKAAIVVGGTGLYFRALTKGLAAMPAVPGEAREAAEAEFAARGEAEVRMILKSLDAPAEARIASGDRQRLVRALAVVRHTGLPLTVWQSETKPVLPEGSWRGVVIEPEREALYGRCDARLAAMVGQGALAEVEALLARRLSPDLPIMKAVGVREFARHLAGEIGLDQALAEAQAATRHYAKRQLTWFRNQTPDWPRIASAREMPILPLDE
jgi:tRNA dimethylallyltransferase